MNSQELNEMVQKRIKTQVETKLKSVEDRVDEIVNELLADSVLERKVNEVFKDIVHKSILAGLGLSDSFGKLEVKYANGQSHGPLGQHLTELSLKILDKTVKEKESKFITRAQKAVEKSFEDRLRYNTSAVDQKINRIIEDRVEQAFNNSQFRNQSSETNDS